MKIKPGREGTTLLINDKILLYLVNFYQFSQSAEVPFSITQQGIAEKVGMYRSHVPRKMIQLSKKGFIVSNKRHVTDCSRKRKVYFLTQLGIIRAKEITQKTSNVPWIIKEIPSKKIGKIIGPIDFSLHSSDKGLPKSTCINYIENAPTDIDFIGRVQELKFITEWFNKSDSRILVIYGIAGIGKTSLAVQLIKQFKEKRNLFWMKIYEWVTVRNILTEFGHFLSRLGRKRLNIYLESKKTINIWEVCNIIKSDFNGIPTLIILDDIHKASKELQSFLAMIIDIVENISGFGAVFLTRELPKFYDARCVNVKKIVYELHLKGLDRRCSEEFLGSKYANKSEFGNIYSLTRGHPLALELIRSHGGFDISARDIYRFINNEIFEKLSEPEKRFLKVVSVHRNPIQLSIFLSDNKRTESNYNTINSLLDKALLIQMAHNTYDIHDIVREFFYDNLTSSELRRYHFMAGNYYISLFSKDPTSSGTFPLEAMHHFLKAKKYYKVVEIALKYSEIILNNGHIEQLKSILDELNKANTKGGWNDILVLKGNICARIGMWDDALKYYETCIRSLCSSPKKLNIGILYEKIGNIYYIKNIWYKALMYYKKSSEIMRQKNNFAGIVLSERGQGLVLWRTGNYRESLEHLKLAMRIAKKIDGNPLIASLFIDMANLSFDVGNFTKAIKYYENSIKVALEHGLIYELARAYYNNASAYLYLEKVDYAFENCVKAEQIFCKTGFIREMAWTFCTLSELFARKGDFKKTLYYLERALEISRQIKDDLGTANAYTRYGIAYRFKKEYKRAEKYFQNAIEILERLNYPAQLADVYFEYGLHYIKIKEWTKGRLYVDKAYQICEKMGRRKFYFTRLYNAMK